MIDSHFIYRPKMLDAERFRAFVADVRTILSKRPEGLRITGMDGRSQPVVMDSLVVLNGDGTRGLEHEPLYIEQIATQSRERNGVHFEFCKTNGKPYDVIVVAVLYALANRFPEVKFVTDSKLEELKPGFDLFIEACHPSGEVQRLYRRPVDDREEVPSP